MASRLQLQTELETLLGSKNVYFQPPQSKLIEYPAIRYSISRIDTRHANNMIYKQKTAYEVVLIDYNPDSEYLNSILKLPYCSFDRTYPAENLHHFVFTLYY